MKTILSIICLLAFTTAFSQWKELPKDEKGFVTFTEVVNIDSADAQKLYSRAKFFVAQTYRSGKDVTQLNDDATKTIVVKAVIMNHVRSLMVTGPWGWTEYQLSLQCKDGRYKYVFDRFMHNNSSPRGAGGRIDQEKAPGFTKATWKQIQDQTLDEMNIIIPVLKKLMTSNVVENW